ncbi:ABC transporter ATP-binding protein [Thiocapsa roseopersicina]|jgi:NitT/TauT family transport system ATP-binding protein|uniref:NitT/TauT family transport system ATP-binding protein n=1 Tax=Thiocapsa roseopersicina TaxID=1058 RepID=A0A1H3DDS2_THIRO|nr:ABC transporter ATP-binding protein [Thiocapsa roseopersicina]SDX64575.1 NitT/TauT family transport system ATP-binding protein [Thiocapsa roseopersicina]
MAIRGTNIKIEGLTHRYRSRSGVTFNRVDLESPQGEALAIIGRSGCGKSTLLHIVAGLLKASEGSIKLDGNPIDGPSPKWVMMFQAPHLFPWMTVKQNVGVGLTFGNWSRATIDSRVDEAIRLVELQDFAQSNVQDLSGGQQQRVALARSLVMEPELLLLDEPFSALDAFTRSSLQHDVRAIAKRLGFNIILVTHDIDEAVIMADRAVIMAGSPGNIVHELDVDLPDPRDRGDPQVQKLRAELMDSFQEAANYNKPKAAALAG